MARDTTTGKYLRGLVGMRLQQVCPKRGLDVLENQVVGTRPGGQDNRMPFVLVKKSNEDVRGIVACKVQNTGGTAEQKVPFEIIRLLEAMKFDKRHRHAWLVLGGIGWTADLVDYYIDGLQVYIPKMKGKVTVLGFDDLLSEKFEL